MPQLDKAPIKRRAAELREAVGGGGPAGGDEAQRDGAERSDFSSASRRLIAAIRRVVPPLENDRALSGDISRLAGAMRRGWVSAEE
jgi:hypothetical protein